MKFKIGDIIRYKGRKGWIRYRVDEFLGDDVEVTLLEWHEDKSRKIGKRDFFRYRGDLERFDIEETSRVTNILKAYGAD